MSTAIWIAILAVIALIGCGWLLIVGRAIRDLMQTPKEGQ